MGPNRGIDVAFDAVSHSVEFLLCANKLLVCDTVLIFTLVQYKVQPVRDLPYSPLAVLKDSLVVLSQLKQAQKFNLNRLLDSGFDR